MMSRLGSVLCSFLSLVLGTASLDLSQLQVYPENGGIAEVFIVKLKNQPYSFNATTAINVCTSLGVSIATRAQVETAQSNGLQTCRYGWVMENIAVIPRTEQNQNCGQNKVGTIVWTVSPSRLFDVFCFNSTGQTKATMSTTPNMTAVFDKRTSTKTTSPLLFLSTRLNKNFVGSSQSPQPSSPGFNPSVIPTIFSSTFTPMTTKTSQTSQPSSSLPSDGYSSSISSSIFTFSSSMNLSSHPFTYSSSVTISSNETDGQTASGKGNSFRVLIPCVILVVVLLIIAGTGAVWYFKIKRPNRLSPWERICHKDVFETEMWKHSEQQNFSMQSDSVDCGDDITLKMEDDTISS